MKMDEDLARLYKVGALLSVTDVEKIASWIEQEDTLGSMLDPTMYVNTTALRNDVRELVQAARAFKDVRHGKKTSATSRG